jgi:hypothetical protein
MASGAATVEIGSHKPPPGDLKFVVSIDCLQHRRPQNPFGSGLAGPPMTCMNFRVGSS